MNLSAQQQAIINQLASTNLIVSAPGCGLTELHLHIVRSYAEQNKIDKVVMLDCNHNTKQSTDRMFKMLGDQSSNTLQPIDGFARRLLLEQQQVDNAYVADQEVQHQRDFKKMIARVAKKHNVDKSALYKAYNNQLSIKVVKSSSLNAAVKHLRRQYAKYKNKHSIVDCNDVYEQFRDNPKLLEECLAGYECIIIDNLQNVTEQQAFFIEQLSTIVPTLVMGGDPCQSLRINNYDDYPAGWQYLYQTLKPTCFKLTESFRINKKQAKLTNTLRKKMRIGLSVVAPETRSSSAKPVYRSFATPEDQNEYLCRRINELRSKGVPYNEIAIIARTRDQLLPIKFALNKEGLFGIPTNDNFVRAQDLNACYKVLFALIHITNHIAHHSDESIPYDDLHCLIDFFCIDHEQKQMIMTNVDQHGISSLKLKRTTENRSLSDRILKLKQSIEDASSYIDSEIRITIEILIKALRGFIRYRFDHHNILIALLSNLKLTINNYKSLPEYEKKYCDTRPSKLGIQLSTCHGIISQQYKYVFVINVVDSMYPFTKYNKNTAEFQLLYSSLTRASELTTICRTPISLSTFGDLKSNDAKHKKVICNHLTKDSSFLIELKDKKYFNIDYTNEQKVEQVIKSVYNKA